MNILVFVITLLIALTIANTARLESFLVGARLRAEYRKEMAATEQRIWKERSQKIYDAHKVSKGTTSRNQGGTLTGKINFRDVLEQPFGPQRKGFEALIEVLFREQQWFQETLDKNENIVEEMLIVVSQAILEQTDKGTVNGVKDLGGLKLHNEDLQVLLKRILEGLVDEEGKSPYLEMRKRQVGVSVYRAKKPLLVAIFGEDIAEEIVAARWELYKKVKRRALTNEQAGQQLNDEFGKGQYVTDDTWLDFSVTKTQPYRD